MAKKVAQRSAHTLAELIMKLREMAQFTDANVIYVYSNEGENGAYFEMEEEVLSDGSKVYNIRFK